MNTPLINAVTEHLPLTELSQPALLPPPHNPAIYLFQPQQRLLLASPQVLAMHGLNQTEACVAMSRLLSCYLPADSNKLKLALQVAAAIRGCLSLTVQTRNPEFLIQHKLQKLQYGDHFFLCAQLQIVEFFRNYN
ncbi:hypothetical protein [Pseudidiomarina planktonica]|nr:hypothetical protein [Pseudidiomarina planktonica]RUO65056.1 hypothetical protein CWI77_00810 [Pseudidiomarina planktonica]